MHDEQKSFRSLSSKVKGLGASGSGVQHWWMQRLTAVGLIPLGLWLIYALIHVNAKDYAGVIKWISFPLNTALLVLTVCSGLYHGFLGMQVIVEDYIHCHATKAVMIIILRLGTIFLAVLALVAIFTCMGKQY